MEDLDLNEVAKHLMMTVQHSAPAVSMVDLTETVGQSIALRIAQTKQQLSALEGAQAIAHKLGIADQPVAAIRALLW